MDLETKVNSDPRRILPSVDRLIRKVAAAAPDLPEWAIRRAARVAIDELREQFSRGESNFQGTDSDLAEVVRTVIESAGRLGAAHPRTVLNATGVVLHTNLGRAPLAEAAAEAVARSLEGYSNLELDLETGRRGSRMGSLEAKLLAAAPGH